MQSLTRLRTDYRLLSKRSTLVWAQELHLAIKKSGSIVDKLAEEKDTEAQDTLRDFEQIIVSCPSVPQGVLEQLSNLLQLDPGVLVWAQELHLAIKKSGSIVDKLAEEKDTEAQDTRVKLQEIHFW
jgi:hypothetical protein